MAQKIIIDADPGIGDAVAATLAILDPDVDVLAITATAGCVSGPTATRNIQAIIKLLDPPKHPRMGSSDAELPAISRSANLAFANRRALSGPFGLGDAEFGGADLHRPHESAKLMIELVRNEPHEITLLTLGPLSNLEIACERAPEFLSLLKGIVCQGGSIQAGGDITAAAEFNMFADVEAARTILRSASTKTLVPLDISAKAVLTFEQFDRLTDTSCPQVSWLMENVLPFALRAHHERLGLEGFPMHEVVALAAITHPRLFSRQTMAVDIETKGELTRGMTVFDRRGVREWHTNIDVLDDVDAQAVIDYFTRIIRRSPA